MEEVMDPTDLTIEILKQIRDEVTSVRHATIENRDELRHLRTELGGRLENVEGTLLELAQQQRFVVRHLGTLAGRDRDLGPEVDALRSRVDAIETRLDSG